MMLSFNRTNVLKMVLLVTMSFGINGQSSKGAPYGIGFYHSDKSLPSSTCVAEFEKVRNFVYPTYYVEVVTDSDITTTVLNKITETSSFSYSKISSTSGGGGRRRNLLRTSTEQQKEIDQKEVDDEEERRLSTERELQSWCYAQCDDRPVQWLIIVGCRTECGLRRRLDGSNMSSNDVSLGFDEVKERDLQKVFSFAVGSSTKILSGQGDTTASQFYMTVRVLIPFTNPCRRILLAMTYEVIPLEITL